MNVHLLSVKESGTLDTFDVVIGIGIEIHTFQITVVKTPTLSDHIILVKGDRIFGKLFQSSPDRRIEIYKIVRSIYNGEYIELPIDLGEF